MKWRLLSCAAAGAWLCLEYKSCMQMEGRWLTSAAAVNPCSKTQTERFQRCAGAQSPQAGKRG